MGCKVFVAYLSEHGLLPIKGPDHGACCFKHSPDFTDCADYMPGDAKLFCVWAIVRLCTVHFQIASLYRPLPDCTLGDSTTHVMLQNACEFGVFRDSDNTCQKLYTPVNIAPLTKTLFYDTLRNNKTESLH